MRVNTRHIKVDEPLAAVACLEAPQLAHNGWALVSHPGLETVGGFCSCWSISCSFGRQGGNAVTGAW